MGSSERFDTGTCSVFSMLQYRRKASYIGYGG